MAYPLTGLLALLLAALFFAAAWGYGRLLPRGLPLPPGTRAGVEVALGAGALGYAAFALGLLGALRPLPLAAVLAGGVLLLLSRPPVLAPRERLRRLVSGGSALSLWSAVAGGVAVVFALLGALLPEVEYDALWYHLAFPARYLQSGRLLDLPCEHMSPTPQHTELLYAYGLLLGDARGAKLIHLGFGLLAAGWAAHLGRRAAGRAGGVLAAALFLTAPTVTWEMTTAYNELPLAFLGAGAAALVLARRGRGGRRVLLIAGVLLGLGMAGKHLGLFFLALLAAVVLLAPARGGAGRRIADALVLSGTALLVALPWYLRAWAYTGNPLFPAFYGVLSRAGVEVRRWDAAAQAGWDAAMGRYGDGRDPLDLLLLPWRMTWDGVAYAGSLGPAWLLFLPLLPLVWGRMRGGARLLALVGLGYFLLWASPVSSFQVRYLVPVLPLWAAAAAAAVRETPRLFARAGWERLRLLPGALLAGALLFNLPLLAPLANARTGWVPHTFQSAKPSAVATVLGVYDPHDFAAARVEPYRAVLYMNRELPLEARVVTFAEAAHFYARPELLMDYSRCVAAGTWGAPAGEEARAFRALTEAGVTHILWDRTRSDLDPSSFALRSPGFLRRHARLLYTDEAVELWELAER